MVTDTDKLADDLLRVVSEIEAGRKELDASVVAALADLCRLTGGGSYEAGRSLLLRLLLRLPPESSGRDVRLDGVMHFVDKWFDDSDPRLSLPPVERANCARETALQWGEEALRQRDALLQAACGVREMLRIVADGRATLPPGKAASIRERLATAIRVTRPLHPSELP